MAGFTGRNSRNEGWSQNTAGLRRGRCRRRSRSVTDDFSDSTLVLVGHGSTLNADSAAPVWQQAEALRRRRLFGQVVECFWKEQPTIAGVLRGAYGSRVFVVPFFISEGYFTAQIIPRELGLVRPGATEFARAQVRGEQTVFYCGAVGSHPSMTEVILARADEVVAQNPGADGRLPEARELSLFIAGHGTGRNENSRKAIERQAELISARRRFHSTQAIFMEEEPQIGRCFELAATADLVIVPFFISDGLHSQEDIPMMLGEPADAVRSRLVAGRPTFVNPTERNGRRVWYARSVGSEPLLVDVIVERVREAVR